MRFHSIAVIIRSPRKWWCYFYFYVTISLAVAFIDHRWRYLDYKWWIRFCRKSPSTLSMLTSITFSSNWNRIKWNSRRTRKNYTSVIYAHHQIIFLNAFSVLNVTICAFTLTLPFWAHKTSIIALSPTTFSSSNGVDFQIRQTMRKPIVLQVHLH